MVLTLLNISCKQYNASLTCVFLQRNVHHMSLIVAFQQNVNVTLETVYGADGGDGGDGGGITVSFSNHNVDLPVCTSKLVHVYSRFVTAADHCTLCLSLNPPCANKSVCC